MSTPETPAPGSTPGSTSSSSGGGTGGYGFQPVAGARMPVPGNAEFLVFAFIWLWLLILWMATDAVNAGTFATLSTILAIGYMLSRGIAKASRVLEQ